jgi:hypothetical protein
MLGLESSEWYTFDEKYLRKKCVSNYCWIVCLKGRNRSLVKFRNTAGTLQVRAVSQAISSYASVLYIGGIKTS